MEKTRARKLPRPDPATAPPPRLDHEEEVLSGWNIVMRSPQYQGFPIGKLAFELYMIGHVGQELLDAIKELEPLEAAAFPEQRSKASTARLARAQSTFLRAMKDRALPLEERLFRHLDKCNTLIPPVTKYFDAPDAPIGLKWSTRLAGVLMYLRESINGYIRVRRDGESYCIPSGTLKNYRGLTGALHLLTPFTFDAYAAAIHEFGTAKPRRNRLPDRGEKHQIPLALRLRAGTKAAAVHEVLQKQVPGQLIKTETLLREAKRRLPAGTNFTESELCRVIRQLRKHYSISNTRSKGYSRAE